MMRTRDRHRPRDRRLGALLKQTSLEFMEDKVPRLAGSLAYYSLFAVGPLLLIVIGIAGLAFGAEAARGEIVGALGGLVGVEAAQTLQTVLAGAYRPRTNVLTTLLGVALLLFAASGVFAQLKDALNTIWEVRPRPGRGILGIVKDRFLSFGAVLGLGFLLLVTLVVTAALAAMGKYLSGSLPGGEVLWQVLNLAISLGVITVIFALMFKFLPDVKIAWRDVAVGAAVTAVLFVLGKSLIGLYIGKRSFGDTFGAAGGLVALLVWVYYSSVILFLGAEFTQVWAKRRGAGWEPDEDAMKVREEDRAEEGIPKREREPRGTRV